MSKKTRATDYLDARGAVYSLHSYDYDPEAQRIGAQAADALGVSEAHVLKTLMVTVDGKAACAIVPSDTELSLKKLSSTLGGKSAEMMKPADAERLTGFKIGGISPFGQKRNVPMVLEERALGLPFVFVNGGQRGLQVKLDPKEIPRLLAATVAGLIASPRS